MMLHVRFQECIDHSVITKAEFNNTSLIKHLRSLRAKIKQVILKYIGHSALEEIVDRKLSPAPRAADAGASTKKKQSQKIALLPTASKFGPQEVNSFSQLCA